MGVSQKKDQGFSLIELLVVIVIIGIIASIGTPKLLSMRTNSSVRADAQDFYSALRQTQSEAVKRSRDACLIVSGNSFHIDIMDNDGSVIGSLPPNRLRPGNSFTNNNFSTIPLPCFNPRGLPIGLSATESIDVVRTNNANALKMRVELTIAGHVRTEVL